MTPSAPSEPGKLPNNPNSAPMPATRPSEHPNPETPNSENPENAENTAETDEDYDESADEDFDPNKVEETVNSEESDEEFTKPSEEPTRKRTRKTTKTSGNDEAEPLPDYAGIETGEGGFVRTRAQRYHEKLENKYSLPGKRTSGLDIDAIFQDMKSASLHKFRDPLGERREVSEVSGDGRAGSSAGQPSVPKSIQKLRQLQEEGRQALNTRTIRIKMRYKFAGELITEEKTVAIDSPEAREYMESHPEEFRDLIAGETGNGGGGGAESGAESGAVLYKDINDYGQPLRHNIPKKKSIIDEILLAAKANKLNTLEKSKLDWTQFVDKEGIRDDLRTHNKGGYLQKQDFLARVEYRLDEKYKQGKK